MSKLLVKYKYIFLIIFYLANNYVCGNYKLPANASSILYNLVSGLPDIYIHSDSEKIGHTWANGNVWEKHLIEKFHSLLPLNDFFVVFDLGAQTGSFSLLAKYFPNSNWYAFEPLQEAADTLEKNLVLNNISNVYIYRMAVSNFCGKTILKMPQMNEWGLSTIGEDVLRFSVITEREVECIDLDSFVASRRIGKVDFLKLDTEGSELHILQGAKKMIMRDHPIMIMEYNEINMKQCGVAKQDIEDFLNQMGYEWHLISTEDILCIPCSA